jgi:hypothetical protein
MNPTTSDIDEIIRNKNPFAGHIVVRPPQIWGKSFPDVPSINAHASNAVFDAVEKVTKGERETVGITITAEKGVGKSHIISRIRHRLQSEEKALFIYMSSYENLNQIKYELLQSVASSLRVIGSQNVMQWQEIATALINETSQWQYAPQQYINSIYPSWLNKHSNKVIDKLTEAVLQKKPEITNPYLLKAILWTLSPIHTNYANYWLSGLELPQSQTEEMGLPNLKIQDRETEAIKTVRQILDIISYYKVPVICFDELDISELADNGFTTAQIIANLTKDLFNSLNKGVLFLAMYRPTWNEQIRALPQAEAVIDRLVSEQSDRQPIALNNLNSDDVVAVVSQWLKEFYESHQKIPPHPLYPFDESKLRELGKSRPTIRSVLKWCAEKFVPPDKLIPPIHPVETCYQNELENISASIDSVIDNEKAISKALRLAFSSLIGEILEGVKIEDIQDIKANKADQGYIDFKIVGNNGSIKIGVDVIQESGGKYVGAALRRLINYEKFDLTRGCLVRSKNINQGAKIPQECLRKLLKEQGGEWVKLKYEDIKPLLAISNVYDNCESYELTKQEILDYIKQNNLAINNPLVCDILSDPSGQEPENLANDDLLMAIPQHISEAAEIIEVNL